MEFIDYYKILGIGKNATTDDVKKAYRKLARKYHPDLNPNDKDAESKFKEVNEANEVLGDPEKRKKYDQYGKDWRHADAFNQQGQTPPRSGGQRAYSGSFNESDFSDFFSSMFGGGESIFGRGQEGSFSNRGGVKYKGQDYKAELHLKLSDVFTTQKHTLTIDGKNIRINVPAGIEDGQTIKIRGYGADGVNGGSKGDLYITFVIKNDTAFIREGKDLHSNVELGLTSAVLGGDLLVDTFKGKAKLKVTPGTQNDTVVRLKGKGFPVYKKEGEFGDLYIKYKVRIPTSLSEKEKEIFSELAKLNRHGK